MQTYARTPLLLVAFNKATDGMPYTEKRVKTHRPTNERTNRIGTKRRPFFRVSYTDGHNNRQTNDVVLPQCLFDYDFETDNHFSILMLLAVRVCAVVQCVLSYHQHNAD